MTDSGHSDTTTNGIRVRVGAQLIPERTDPDMRVWFYAYRVHIENVGTERAHLLSRHWIIVDSKGHTEEVRGPGVVGEHPDLAPGESFEYVSSCPLTTEWGTMEGEFTFRRPDGGTFESQIGRFFLAPTAAPLEPIDR